MKGRSWVGVRAGQSSAVFFFFFKQKTAYEIKLVTGVQTCALPIFPGVRRGAQVRVAAPGPHSPGSLGELVGRFQRRVMQAAVRGLPGERAGREAELRRDIEGAKIGRASCRERV